MKTFNESMIENYKELNNCGSFEIEGYEGYTVKFNNHSKTLETEYPYAKELRAWWFDLEEEPKTEDEKKVEFILENGFEEITDVAVEELSKKTTKSAKFSLDRIEKFNQRVFRKDDLVIVCCTHILPVQEKKQLSNIFKCDVKDASKYFDEIGMWLVWNNL